MIPWRDWFSFAVTKLGLAPGAFWRLTLTEWRWLVGASGASLNRAGLEALIALYPDKHHD